MADDQNLPENDLNKYPDPNVREAFRRERLSKQAPKPSAPEHEDEHR